MEVESNEKEPWYRLGYGKIAWAQHRGVRIRWLRWRESWALRDSDVARLLDIETRSLNRWVDRRPEAFPESISDRLRPMEMCAPYLPSESAWRPRVLAPRMFTAAGVLQARLLRAGPQQVELVRWLADRIARAASPLPAACWWLHGPAPPVGRFEPPRPGLPPPPRAGRSPPLRGGDEIEARQGMSTPRSWAQAVASS